MSARPRTPPGSVPPPARREWSDLPPSLCDGFLILLAVLVYWRVLGAGLIWDDSGHVTAPQLRSLGGLGRIWMEVGATQQYYPLLHSAFWLEHHLWGDAPLGYHLVNIIQHGVAACLFARLLLRLAVPGAWLAAFLFVLHPVCVESVAWVTEQKNTLSTILYLGAALTYLRFERDRRPVRYVLATLLFVSALCSKTVTASLPAALLVVLWWMRARVEWRKDVLPLLPWFALSLGFGMLSSWVERTLIGAQDTAFALSLVERCILAGRVVWFYFSKLLWPTNLNFIYPHWAIDTGALWQWLPLITALLALGLGIWWTVWSRAPLAVILLFGGSLFPVLGFVNVYPFKYSYVADHFQYLASLSIFAGAAALLTRISGRAPRWIAASGVLALGVTLGTLTGEQTKIYKDVFVLYQSVLDKNPTCWMAHTNLAVALASSGRPAEALVEIQESLRLSPDSAEAENNLGSDLAQLGRPQEAIVHLERALTLQPRYPQALNNLALALSDLGNLPRAITCLESALEMDARLPVTHGNLGLVLARAGRLPDALIHFEKAVQLNPNYAEAEFKWGTALMFSERFPEAVPHFERSLQLEPNSSENHTLYAHALAKQERWDESVAHFRKALELKPNSSDAHMNLALALRQTNQLPEAAAEYKEALRLKSAPAR